MGKINREFNRFGKDKEHKKYSSQIYKEMYSTENTFLREIDDDSYISREVIRGIKL